VPSIYMLVARNRVAPPVRARDNRGSELAEAV